MCRDVLALSRRGHMPEDTCRAARLIKAYGLELILQMMTGLPADTPEKSVYTAKRLIDLKPDGVRIYPTVVVRDTALYDLWRRGDYKEHTVGDAVKLCARLYTLFERAGIPVVRMGLNPTEDLSGGDAAAGAYHPAFGELVFSRIYLERSLELLRPLGRVRSGTRGVRLDRVSCMVGHRKSNIEALERALGPITVHVRACPDAGPGEIVIMNIENGP
jgi:histone acetyltransferase (RNA polymerase elongator complex component)